VKILIAHGYIEHNMGDVMMTIELNRVIREQFPDATIDAAVHGQHQVKNLTLYSKQYGVKFNKILPDAFRTNIPKGYDFFLSTGGDFISVFWGRIPEYAAQMEYARKRGIRTAICFQTLGPFGNNAEAFEGGNSILARSKCA